ncbi:FAD-dependent oxidoreductase [Acidisphaera sp. L21]|uniref:FAD-dependent oxidoreductase n=1 Tax=Acidisphaera sp. L21 TaxID=1641851 RepID=UPI00131E1FD4|nr:FAD-dependent oxidoreductase [Acidisphaera sp. L21]
MSIADTRRAQIFPVLTASQRQAALRFASGPVAQCQPGQVLYGYGAKSAPAFLVLAGAVDILTRDGMGRETHIVSLETGQFSGEVAQLAGRPTLVEGRAGPEGCEVAPFDAVHLRALVIGSAEIGETVMRAFILRRAAYILEGVAGSLLVGTAADPWLVRLQGFLRRNGYPHTVLDPAIDPDAASIVDRFALHAPDLPIALCPDGTLLKRPTDGQIALALGITPALRPEQVYDVAVVGAGPAGLATAVYAASEGLSTIVLDSHAFGGQAGASSRIENYFGFPTGISGVALTARAFTQAQKFGAEIAIPLEVARLDCGNGGLRVVLTDERTVQARTMVIASGVRYRRPNIPKLAEFEGAGIAYWASPVEAKLCEGEEVALVGGGNSAGRAVVFLASKVKQLHLVVRGTGLEASMSQYLIERIAALPNVEVHTRTEVVALDGEPDVSLSSVTFRNRDTGKTKLVALRHLFLFIGADPNTEWLESCPINVDEKGFVITGDQSAGTCLPLETSVPGVFAIGDVRCGSTKRVAAAVGEGAAVVAQLHATLAKAKP